MTKKSQYSIQKIIIDCKQNFKIRKEHVLIKCLFKVLAYLLYSKYMVKPYYVKGVHRVKIKHLFADVLQSSCS